MGHGLSHKYENIQEKKIIMSGCNTQLLSFYETELWAKNFGDKKIMTDQ